MQGGYYYSVDEAARLASKGLVAPVPMARPGDDGLGAFLVKYKH